MSRYYYSTDGNTTGPVELDVVLMLIQSGLNQVAQAQKESQPSGT